MFKIDIDALLGNVQLDTTHMPGRFQTEETPVKIRILHAAHRRAGALPTPSDYPPETRESRFAQVPLAKDQVSLR